MLSIREFWPAYPLTFRNMPTPMSVLNPISKFKPMLARLRYLPGLVLAFSSLLLPVLAAATEGENYAQARRWGLNMPVGVTELGNEIYGLHMLILWICVGIGVIVFGAMFVSMYLHRKSRGARPASFHEHTGLEISWTVAAFLILVAMALPSTTTMIKIYDSSASDVDILVTGYQWKWKYEYVDTGVSFFSTLRTPQDEIYNEADKGEFYLLDVDEPMVVPVGKKIRFLITANDVLHAWWVPDLAVKRDAIPGFINESWAIIEKEGIYRGQCAELCGKDHGFMPIVVRAVAEEEYVAWLAEKRAAAERERALRDQVFTLAELMERGQKVYARNCVSCHLPDGTGVPGAFPALLAGSMSTGPINEHLDIVLNGRPGTSMAAFGAQLSEADLAAVITYERNAWGNNMGDLLQPLDVVNYQRGKK